MTSTDTPLENGILSHAFLTVRDLRESLQFYSAVLGFTTCHFIEGECAFLELPKSPGLRIALYVSSTADQAVASGRFLMIDVQDVDVTTENLRLAGVEVSDVFDVPYGRAAHFTDPDGNVFEIHQCSS